MTAPEIIDADHVFEPKRTDQDYLNFYPFEGDKEPPHIECRSVKIVTTKVLHWCAVGILLEPQNDHEISPGTRAVVERAKVDGKFGSCYYCLDCLERLMQFYDNMGKWPDDERY